MKILHLIQKPQHRGAETFACQLGNHQVTQGHEVKIVSIFSGEANLPWKKEISSLHASETTRFLDLPAWNKLTDYIREFQPDIVQANSGDTLKYAVLSKTIFGWKIPIIFRNASEVGRYINTSVQRIFNQFLYKKVSGVISVSHASKNDLLDHFPFLQDHIKVIPIGLEEYPSIKTITLKPEGKNHIIHVGGFSFEKNHIGLIKIFKKALKLVPNLQLHLIGDGPLRSDVENFILKEKLDEKISFYGFVKNPLPYIKSADILLLPSIIEGLPGVILEAMYCKTPVIAYDVGGISEILNEATGTLIEKGNEEEFAAAISHNLEESKNGKVEKAYTMVAENFMNNHIAKNFLEFYKKVVK